MAEILKGELQDYSGNTLYPHSKADVVFCEDGKTAQEKFTKYENALGSVTGKTDSLEVDDTNVLATSKAVKQLSESLGGFTPVIDETGKITGYTTTIGGADTVFPFSKGGVDKIVFRITTAASSHEDHVRLYYYADLYQDGTKIETVSIMNNHVKGSESARNVKTWTLPE